MVPVVGLEPTYLPVAVLKTAVSTSSTTRALALRQERISPPLPRRVRQPRVVKERVTFEGCPPFTPEGAGGFG